MEPSPSMLISVPVNLSIFADISDLISFFEINTIFLALSGTAVLSLDFFNMITLALSAA